MRSIASVKPLDKKEQQKHAFLTEIINSQFNLITDNKVKTGIINTLHEIPENTLPEQLLKSYLYIMIGNIARSDNILRSIINTPPRVNWEKSEKDRSLYHRLARDEVKQILNKLGRHPADRSTFELLGLYLQSYYNEEALIRMADDIDTSRIESSLNLRIIESLAPSLTHYLRLSSLNEERRIKALRAKQYPLQEQSYWFWPFMEIDPLISEHMTAELQRIEKEDQLWLIYLLENEKLADLFSRKSGKSFLPGRRPFLKEGLNDPRSFMMSLYKLIELGDINPELVTKTTQYLTNE